MTRIGLGTILGPMQHLLPELIERIQREANITKRLERINRWMLKWIHELVDPNALDNDWTIGSARGALNIRRLKNDICRLREGFI